MRLTDLSTRERQVQCLQCGWQLIAVTPVQAAMAARDHDCWTLDRQEALT
jgi:hypothetical protein